MGGVKLYRGSVTEVKKNIDDQTSRVSFVGDRSYHTTILGQTRVGKTALLHNLVFDDLLSNRSACVIDPHGDLITDILQSLPADHSQKVKVLSVNEVLPFGLNLFQCGDTPTARDNAVGGIIQIFKKLLTNESGSYPNMQYVLRNVARTIMNSGYTMAEVPALFYNENFRNSCLSQVTNPAVHTFWHDYLTRSPTNKTSLIGSTVNKIDEFISSETVGLIFSQPETTVDFRKILSTPGQILLIKIPIGQLGRGVVEFLGMILLSQLSQAIYERVNRFPFHLYIDEYHLFANTTTAQLYKEASKFGVYLTSALQTLESVDQENRAALLNAGTLCLFSLIGGYDSDILSKQLKMPPQTIELVPKPRLVPNIKKQVMQEWVDEEKQRESEALRQEIKELFNAEAKRLGYREDAEIPDNKFSKAVWNKMSAMWQQVGRLEREYYQLVTHEEQDGFIPVVREEPKLIESKTRHGDERHIYDMVADKPRPYSDLLVEMSNILATLPPYNCYIQTINEQKEIVETRLVTTPPPVKQRYGQEQATAIIDKSIVYFGRPAETVRAEAEARIAPFLKPDTKQDTKQDDATKPPEKEPISRIKKRSET